MILSGFSFGGLKRENFGGTWGPDPRQSATTTKYVTHTKVGYTTIKCVTRTKMSHTTTRCVVQTKVAICQKLRVWGRTA